jgi:hypothetical protein
MPDDAVTVDYMLEHSWIVGDPSEYADRFNRLYDEVGGFGYVLTTTHDPGDHGLEQTSLRLLEDDDLPESTPASRRRAVGNAEAQPSCRVGGSQAWRSSNLVPDLVG